MTENESAIETLTFYKEERTFNPEDENVLDYAIKALEEIHQYRALGTVEELREAREKQRAKKITHEGTLHISCTCPNCKRVVDEFETFGDTQVRVTFNYCHFCGQKLDWSEEE